MCSSMTDYTSRVSVFEPCLLSLIETTIPIGVTFNTCGVARKGLRYCFKSQKLDVHIDICALNGLWGGGIHIMTNTWGVSIPIIRCRSFVFSSFEECTKHFWAFADATICKYDELKKDYSQFRKSFKNWQMLSMNDKLNSFKETTFYG